MKTNKKLEPYKRQHNKLLNKPNKRCCETCINFIVAYSDSGFCDIHEGEYKYNECCKDWINL